MKFKIAVAQTNPRLGDLKHNLGEHLRLAEQALKADAALVVFPELSLTGYWLRDLTTQVALRLDDEFWKPLLALSHKISLVVGFVEETPEALFYNSVAYLEAGRMVHVHRKIFLPNYGMFEEHRFYAPGNAVRAFDTRLGRLGMLVCYDWWHALGPMILVQDRATLLLGPVNSPARGIHENENWDSVRIFETAMSFHAKANSVPVVMANRVGFEDGLGFWGGSGIWDPNGRPQVRAPFQEPALIVGEYDSERVRLERINTPAVRDERLDLALRELQRIQRER